MREFGNTTRLKEQSHEVVGFRFETVLQDLHFAIRQLRRSPGFTLTAILMLALGMGASVAIFAFVDAALIKPLPYADPNRLVDVNERVKLFPRSNLSYQDYLDWKKMNTVFSAMEAYTGTGYLLNTPAGAEPVQGGRVSAGFFRVLGVKPMLGRDFYDTEDMPGAADTVILSYETWQETVWRKKGRHWPDGRAERHAKHDHWCASARFPVCAARQSGVLGDAAYADQLREETEAATISTVLRG